MASKIKTFRSVTALVLDTTSPRAKALLEEGQGRLPEVRLAGPCHGSFTPARISRSRPPCVIPIMGSGTGRKYPPAGVMAQSARHGLVSGRMEPLGTLLGRHLCRHCLHRWSWRILPRRWVCRERVQDRIFTFQGARLEQTAGAELCQNALHDLLIDPG